MLLGLPIDGHPMCGATDPTGWRDRVSELINIRPPEVAGPNEKDKKPSGIHSGWLTAHFHTCPKDANDSVVQRYTCAWLWHLVAGFLFFDRSGNTISWMMLPILRLEWDMISTFS
jgi:hypothetical protein